MPIPCEWVSDVKPQETVKAFFLRHRGQAFLHDELVTLGFSMGIEAYFLGVNRQPIVCADRTYHEGTRFYGVR